MWEVFTCGKMPYSRMKNAEVVERVQRGHVLERPKYCAKDVYEVGDTTRPPPPVREVRVEVMYALRRW